MKKVSHVSVLQTILIGGLALSLAGCEVGEDYTPPETQTSANWISSDQQEAQNTIDREWWKNFNDPILTQLIDKASQDNLDVKIAEARIAEARAQITQAEWALLPSGDLKGTATREANQLALPGGSANPFASLLHKPFNMYQTGFDASWELDLFGGGRRAEEGAEAQMQASEASRDDVMVSLRAEVARTYVSIRQYQAQLRVAEDTLMSNKRTLQLATQRADAGEAPRLDVTQAEAEVEQAQQQIPALHSQLVQAEYSMDVLLGEQPGATQKIVIGCAPILVSGKKLVLTAPASVIADRPDIRVAERKLAAATAQRSVALAKFFPDISLTGFFGVLNTSTNQLISGNSKSWLAQGSVVWPILSYGNLSANLDNADASQQEAMANYQKTVLGALSDVEKALTAYNEQQKFLQSATAEVEHNKHARDIAQERYKSGLTSFLEVLDADRTLYESQDRLTQARAAATQDLIALYKSLGGGWQASHT